MKNQTKILILFLIIVFGCNLKNKKDNQADTIDTASVFWSSFFEKYNYTGFYSKNSDSIREYLKKNFSNSERYIVASRPLYSEEPIKPSDYGDSLLILKEKNYWLPKILFDDTSYMPIEYCNDGDSTIYFSPSYWYCGIDRDSFKMKFYEGINILLKYNWYKLLRSPISNYFPETMSFFPDIDHIALLAETNYKIKQDSNTIYISCDSVKSYIDFSATMFDVDDFFFGGVKSFHLEIKDKKLISEYYHLSGLDIVVDYLYFEDENKDINKMQQLVFYIDRYADTAFKDSRFAFGKEYLKIKKNFGNRFK